MLYTDVILFSGNIEGLHQLASLHPNPRRTMSDDP